MPTRQKALKQKNWLDDLPQETKAQLAQLCRWYGEAFKADLPEIVRAYYNAKKLKNSPRPENS